MVQKTIPLWVIFRQFILLSWRMICVFGAVTCIVGYLYGTWATVLMFIIGFFAVCYLCQRQFIYFPNVPVTSRTFVQTPGAMGMSFENVFLQTTDRVKLNAMFIHRQDADVAKRPTVLYLHGNAGNIGHQLVCAKGFHALCGFNVFLLEYRGYGKSEGSPSEEGFRKDAQTAIEYLLSRSDVCRDQIILFGRSIGGAVALDIAADPRFRGLLTAVMVENTFTSIHAVSALYVPWTRWLPSWMFRDKYHSISKVGKLQCAALYLSGEQDELVPSTMMTELFLATGSAIKCIERFPTGTHNTTWRCPKYHEAVSRFVRHALHERAHPEPPPPPNAPGGLTLLDIWGAEADTAPSVGVAMDALILDSAASAETSAFG
eukprot:m.12402 g.12402  ORF g.12402 m.12402 type:complete len:374 (+) comp2727_c0_seq2:74-1195(+)